ncbi:MULTISPECIES: SufE family protein [Reichenbachiella]|uniref:Cysteine desulfuration protein SufE n=1 Tax=Reichenbachiella agariperforans TaxID=156994 RepID=A0A1M6QKV0_REIAG|nr:MULTISPECIES: SufE family protein [Reichenbachiella]MBU2914409.1 SufE family protein [Reichenbachiella agariperforans]PIB36362.1 Fe-S metabolism protein SufE [Reichenbachiella sp. 5M10]SHK20798.1 cysteine desulfuration protein SufE [Reichenbachiella agariperforans]
MATINSVQESIIENFGMLDGDMEMTIGYIMELGAKLPEFPEEHRTDENIVKGCQSKVWLYAHLEGDKVIYQADSNTAITKGLVSMLTEILSGQTPDDILSADLFFQERIGMNRFIGTQRSNGFGAMIKQMQIYALALKSKIGA